MFMLPWSLETFKVLPRRMMMEVWRRMNIGLSEDEVWEPLSDVYEDMGHYFVLVELPGVRKDDLVLTIDKTKLTIRGTKKRSIDDEDVKRVVMECLYGNFEKVIELSEEVDEDKVSAELTNGMLKITLPKKVVSSGKRITIANSES